MTNGVHSTNPLLELTPAAAGGATPIFCVQGAGRGDALYAELASQLGSTQPFYELRCAVEGDEADVEALASELLAVVQAQVESGPVALAGWSFGGLVAFEMARQLRSAAKDGPPNSPGSPGSLTLERLVLIDMVEPGMALPSYEAEAAAVGAIVRSTELLAGAELPAAAAAEGSAALAGLPLDQKVTYAVELMQKHGVIQAGGPAAALASAAGLEELTATAHSFARSIRALLAYAPAGAPTISHTLADLAANGCPVLSFVAKDFRLEGMQPFSFPANVSVVSVDGDHWQLLQGACVTQLAKSITANPQKKVAKRGGRKLGSKLGSKITKK